MMKILWLVNVLLPEASMLFGDKPSQSGGWLINTAKQLTNQDDFELAIAFPYKKAKDLKKIEGEKVTYYAFSPISLNNKKEIEDNLEFDDLIEDFKPDIVHLHGTELAHTLSMINACKKNNVKTVVSIQGLVSIYAKHMFANLPWKTVYGFTLRNLIRKDNVIGMKKQFEQRGKNEIEALKKANHIIGRTTWDKACTSQINPKAEYHFCNETLREDFYHHTWDINKCDEHSIFLSQGQYPIKGLHYMIEALPIILKKYPNTKIYISGKNIIKSDTFKDKLSMTHYGIYIKKIIRRENLENNIIFTGPLKEAEMVQRYLKSNVFVCPSSIENSPNSLGEAMILGVPCVAADVGGVADMMRHGKEGFVYQTDAPYMLAHYICEIFRDKQIAIEFSKNARAHALQTHNIENNLKKLIEIYNSIFNTKIDDVN